MKTFQVTYLIGRVGREPALRYTPDGQPVTTLSVATDQPGAKNTATVEWHRVVLRDRLAEVANRYLGRGRLIYIAGRLTYRQWQDAEGHQRQITEIAASDLVLLDHRPEGSAQQQPGDQTDEDALPF